MMVTPQSGLFRPERALIYAENFHCKELADDFSESFNAKRQARCLPACSFVT